jgi:hypothetical protein
MPGLAAELDVVLGGLRVHVSHGHELGAPTPEKLVNAYEADVIVYGHTHVQKVTLLRATLVVNPGSAGPRRFDVVPSVARLVIDQGAARVEVIPLE